VEAEPAILFQIDEFGMFLSAAADRRRSPRHITDILDNMTELYTSAGGIFLGAEYANHDGLNDRRDVNQPCLCVYGTTTLLHFWNALQGSNVVDGSLARFIIVPTTDDYPEENLAAGPRRAPRALIASLKQIAQGGGYARGNLAGILPGPETAVDPMVVPMLAEARDAFRALSAENPPTSCARPVARRLRRSWRASARTPRSWRSSSPSGVIPSRPRSPGRTPSGRSASCVILPAARWIRSNGTSRTTTPTAVTSGCATSFVRPARRG